jgi:hypothetical protein
MAKGTGRTKTTVQEKDIVVFYFSSYFSYYLVAQCTKQELYFRS